jgi:sucrose phosphorylase
MPVAVTERIQEHLAVLYPDVDVEHLATEVIAAVGIDHPADHREPQPESRWSAADAVLITYGDSIVDDESPPLQVLARVADRLVPAISMVHILPFGPSSSDRGFSVIDYTAVDPALGTWDDIAAIGQRVDLMADLVCNHASVSSTWFGQLLADEAPGRDYFVTTAADADISTVVRPRSLPLLHEFQTASGPRHVWCTFSADQADLDHTNPAVLLEMLRIIDHYVANGARFIRLDAVAYLWKDLGTPCIHLPQTHEMIKLWHTLLQQRAPRVAIVTETNVPSEENLSYFGAGDEAHVIYNFSLPPLVIEALLHGRSNVLSNWLAEAAPAPPGCTYLNFLASHDGMGVRPAEGLLTDAEIGDLVAITQDRGGLHGTYDSATGPRPYELNISLWDLLAAGTSDDPPDGHGLARFVSAHAIMLSIAGVPAIYVNSLFAQPNDRTAADASGVKRDIGRARITLDRANRLLDGDGSAQSRALHELLDLLRIRAAQAAFHPEASQRVAHVGPHLLGLWRQSTDGDQQILSLHNCTADIQRVEIDETDLTAPATWHDLISGEILSRPEGLTLAAYQSRWLTPTG